MTMKSSPPRYQKVSFTNGNNDDEFMRRNNSENYPLYHRSDGTPPKIWNPKSSRYYHETNNDDNDDGDGAILFSSPPVTTPTRPGMMTTPTKSPAYNKKYRDENDESEYLRGSANNHAVREQQLEEALRWETQRREAAEREVANLLSMLQSKDNVPGDKSRKSTTQITADLNYIEDRLDKATNLLAKKSSDNNGPSVDDEKNKEIDNQMYEYYELATAFYNEQKHHSELDGEEFIPREDIVWLLHELIWRYEEILKKFELNRRHKINTSSDDCEEWKECVNELVAIIKKMVKESSQITNSDDVNYSDSKDDTTQSDNAHKHTEANQYNHQSMETMKRKYQEQIANMSQLVSDLKSKLIDQEYGQRKLQEAIDEERHNFALSTEGSSARVRYLEGMVRSLETEMKNSRNRKNNCIPTHEAMPMTPPFRPAFMRDLTSDVVEDAENSIQDVSNVDSDEITILRNQIISLGSSLAESESERATLLDEFQNERQNYILQFKQMSELLKRFTEGTECNYTT